METNSNSAPVQTSEANPNINSNQNAEGMPSQQEPQSPAITPEAVAEYLGTTPEGLESFTKFSKANGGLDKVFGKMKQTISNPQPQQPDPTQAPNQNTQTQMVMGGPVNGDGSTNDVYIPPKPAEGFITPNEYLAQKLNEDLAAKYPEISDYIKKGDYLKDGTAWGMTLVDQAGNMNLKLIDEFLGLKAKAAAPAPTSMPLTSTPTVDYVHQEGEIVDQKMADEIMAQGNTHPRYAEAQKFTKERLWGKSEQKQK